MGCNYGSLWRKWDFHVHTPYSILSFLCTSLSAYSSYSFGESAKCAGVR